MVSDSKAVERLMHGDISAYEFLFRKYYGIVYCFVRNMLKDSSAAEDIAQDIFMRIWKDRNMSLNWLKHRKVETGYAPVWESPYDDAPDSIVAEKEMRLLVDLVVSGMPEQRRRIFEWTMSDVTGHICRSGERSLSGKKMKAL